MNMGMHIENEIEASVFISYAWGDKSGEFVGILKHRLFKLGWATPGMDDLDYKTSLLDYRGWITDFMEKDGLGKYVVVLIDDKYLKSEMCISEFNEIFRNPKFHYRIFPLVFDDANIFSLEDNLQYIQNWEDRINKIEDQLRNVKENEYDSNLLYFDLNRLTNLRNNMVYDLQSIRDMNVLSIDKDNYDDAIEKLIQAIEKQLEEDRLKKRNK